jgi:DNA-binding transcriptional LysR family regulator
MELRHLRYFIAVAEELNFSRAAARLHVSQPPLSRQIRDLEAELKVNLFDRNRQGVRLTRVGHAMLARSRKLVRDAESLRAEAQMIDKESQEELRIGYAPSPTAVIISRVLCRYHEVSPGARVTLHDLTGIYLGDKAVEKHRDAATQCDALSSQPRSAGRGGNRAKL